MFDAEEDYDSDMDILDNEGSELQLISYEDIYLNAGNESAEIEMSNADNAIALDADSVIVTGLFSARGAMDVDGAAHLNSTLHVDGNTDIDGDFDVDGVTTLDSLNVHEDADFDMDLHVDTTFEVASRR